MSLSNERHSVTHSDQKKQRPKVSGASQDEVIIKNQTIIYLSQKIKCIRNNYTNNETMKMTSNSVKFKTTYHDSSSLLRLRVKQKVLRLPAFFPSSSLFSSRLCFRNRLLNVFAKILSSATHEACQKDPTYFIGHTKSVLSKNWFLTTLTGKKVCFTQFTTRIY